MSDSRFPLVITLRSDDGKVSRTGTINHRTDTHTFNSVPPGRYTVSGLFADGSNTIDLRDHFSLSNNSRRYGLQDSGIAVSTSAHTQSPSTTTRSKPPTKAIVGFAVTASLASNFGGAAPLINEVSSSLLRSRQPQSIPTQRVSRPEMSEKIFSDRVEAQLRTCVKNNASYFTGVPTLVGLLKSASWERETENEFEQQLIYLYTDYQQLRTALNRCDPILAQEVFVARSQAIESEKNITVFVTEALVNVRVGPGTDSRVIEPLQYGTPILLDQGTTAGLSEQQKLAISQGAGWQPVILSNGQSGYIYSLYISGALPENL